MKILILEVNQIFRKLTKDKKANIKELEIKGRTFIRLKSILKELQDLSFDELCNQNIGAEDYIRSC